MQIWLYILFGLLVTAAVAMQVWMARATTPHLPASRRPLALVLRSFNVAALIALAVLVVYMLMRR